MRRLSIEKGDAFILVYSPSDAASWQEVRHLRQLILEEKGAGNSGALGQPSDSSQYSALASDASEKPISSLYDAASRLSSAAASAGRRASCASGQLTGKLSGTPIVVAANKCDLDSSQFEVDQEQAERLVRETWVSSSWAPP